MVGEYFQGPSTDTNALGLRLSRQQARDVTGDALNDIQLATQGISRNEQPRKCAGEVELRAKDRVVDAFDTERHAELSREIDDYQNGPSFVNDLRDDSTGQEEWFAYKSARAKPQSTAWTPRLTSASSSESRPMRFHRW